MEHQAQTLDHPHRYKVTGMDCASCVAKIETALSRLEGVENIQANASTETLTAQFKSDAARKRAEQTVVSLGYGLRSLDAGNGEHDHAHGDGHAEHLHDHGASEDGPWWRTRRAVLTGGCAAVLGVAYIVGLAAPSVERWAFIAALAVGLIPIARRALVAARYGTPFSIEMLMTIAAVGAVAIGATEEAAIVVLLFLIGELLEGVAARRARDSIRGLSSLIPKTALRIESGETKIVGADELNLGDVILVRPGDRIPADGAIIEGTSDIDEAPVTGESVPKQKGVGESVFAGTVNGVAALHVRVSAKAADNTIARVIKLVEEAQESKAPTERFIDRFSRYYTPVVVVVASAVALSPPLLAGGSWLEWTYKGLAILLIGCPCALVISTPAAIAAALAAGARRGLLLKGGDVLEKLGSLTTIALDKTGTLTEGRPRVTDVIEAGRDSRQILSLAAALEVGSSHPMAQAILEHAKSAEAPLPPAGEARAVPGKGVVGKVGGETVFLGSVRAAAERTKLSPAVVSQIDGLHGEGKTVSLLLAGDSIAGIIAMRDEPRPDAKTGLARLHALGLKTIMLTGDNAQTAAAVGKTLGIEPRGELLPQDKLAAVEQLRSQGERVGKVGDGINDAPALAAADVGIAMGSGTDVALETADAAILHGRVVDIADMVQLSRTSMANIHQNIAMALGLKAVFLVTTIAGLTGLWPAILADTGATVLVTLNALRLIRFKPE